MKVAIIGLGISGMGAAYILKQNGHDITCFEKNDYIGGHSRTIEVENGVPVDTGFIVFNYRNYPNLTALFDKLEVPVEKSDMSFAASIDNSWLEYGTQNTAAIFAQKRNLLRPKFIKMLRDIFKFNAEAKNYADSDITLGECLDKMGMSDWFKKYYLLAIGGAIWSTPLGRMLDFPARSFIKFFDNHGLLTTNDQPQWFTVSGGSREYVKRLTASYKDSIKLGSNIKQITRKNGKVQIDGEEFDHVFFGCHSDQALKMIADATTQEQQVIGNFKYQKNQIYVHSDISFMPKNKACWASWVYKIEGKDDLSPQISLSYYMNSLQHLKTQTPIIVTLNPTRKPENIHNEYVFEHPVFDEGAISAQDKIASLQGQTKTWFMGAYQRHGFHEDGLLSAVNACKAFGAKIPWEAK